MLTVNEETCVGCGWCQTFCPKDALCAWGYLEIDYEKCDECQVCINFCPTDSLSMATI
ncbi:MAG: 4Fe-4S binding protein [Pseudomonadota bacterium]